MNDLDPETRALLELGRLGDDPADHEVARNRAALGKRLGAAALGAGALASSASKATAAVSLGSAAAVKGALLASAVLALGVATWHFAGSSPGTGSALAPQSDPSAKALPTPVPEAVLAPAPAAVAEPSAPQIPIKRNEAPARAVPPRSIKEELELVRSAQQALNRGDAGSALTLLAEHARKYPSGALWQDREASRVFATCRLGDAAGARALADAFLRRAPLSPFADRVRATCREAH
jgi:hypothetical protein